MGKFGNSGDAMLFSKVYLVFPQLVTAFIEVVAEKDVSWKSFANFYGGLSLQLRL
jgi:hypothetical protein